MAKRLSVVSLLLALMPAAIHAGWPHLTMPRIDHFSIQATTGRTQSNWHGQADVTTVAFDLGHSLSPRTELDLVIQPFAFVQPRSWFGYSRGEDQETVRAISGSVLLRHWLYPGSHRARPYLELAAGPMASSRRVPAATSRFNVVSQAGFGVLLRPDQQFPLLLGYRFSHISNGGYAPRNPGLNLHSLLIGFRGNFGHR
jgi:Lipid A 3-O-deacylase (PagL)